MIGLIDHFSKFLMSVPIKNNNDDSVLFSLKQYFTYIGKSKILQSDNGTEYNNSIINNYLASNNVEHIFSSPRHPQTNGVVEVVYKEVKNYVLNNLNIIEDDITFIKFNFRSSFCPI